MRPQIRWLPAPLSPMDREFHDGFELDEDDVE